MKKIIYLFGLIIVSSCQQEEIEPNPSPNTPVNNNYFISYHMDGVTFTEENGVGGYQIGYSNGSSIDGQNNAISVDPGSGFYNFDNSSEHSSGISFKNNDFVLSEYSSDYAGALMTIFTVGQHTFNAENDAAQGVEFYFSKNGVMWSSDVAIQPLESNFEVTESVASTDQLGTDERKVKGEFNCTIFNEAGVSKVVTNGQFYLNFTAP
jgi:hypothetical protein